MLRPIPTLAPVTILQYPVRSNRSREMSGMGAFMERGVDLPDGRVVDPTGRGGVRGRPSSGANVGVSFLELPLDAAAVDGVEKADPFDDFANRLLGARRVGSAPGSSMARGLIGLMKNGRYSGEALIKCTASRDFTCANTSSMFVTRRQTCLGPPTSFVFLGMTSCRPA